MFFDNSQKTISIRLNDETRKQLNRLADNFGLDPDEYSAKDLLEKIFDAAEKRIKPNVELKEKLVNLSNVNAALQNTVEQREKKIAELQQEIHNLKNSYDVACKLNEEAEKTANELENAKQQIQFLQKRLEQTVDIADDEIIVKINPFLDALIERYLKNPDILESFEKLNKNGKNDGIFDKINTGNIKQDVANLLTTTFVASVHGKVLKKLFTNAELKQLIYKYQKQA